MTVAVTDGDTEVLADIEADRERVGDTDVVAVALREGDLEAVMLREGVVEEVTLGETEVLAEEEGVSTAPTDCDTLDVGVTEALLVMEGVFVADRLGVTVGEPDGLGSGVAWYITTPREATPLKLSNSPLMITVLYAMTAIDVIRPPDTPLPKVLHVPSAQVAPDFSNTAMPFTGSVPAIVKSPPT